VRLVRFQFRQRRPFPLLARDPFHVRLPNAILRALAASKRLVIGLTINGGAGVSNSVMAAEMLGSVVSLASI